MCVFVGGGTAALCGIYDDHMARRASSNMQHEVVVLQRAYTRMYLLNIFPSFIRNDGYLLGAAAAWMLCTLCTVCLRAQMT